MAIKSSDAAIYTPELHQCALAFFSIPAPGRGQAPSACSLASRWGSLICFYMTTPSPFQYRPLPRTPPPKKIQPRAAHQLAESC